MTRMKSCATRRKLARLRKAGSSLQLAGNCNQMAVTTPATPATAAFSDKEN